MPDDDQVGNASNRIPSPFLRSALTTKGGKETSENHDQVGNDGHDGASTINTSEQAQVEQKQRCRDAPVNITSPINLTIDVLVGVGHVLV